MTATDKLEDFQSVKQWFAQGRWGRGYTPATQGVHLRYLTVWCSLTGMTPDELANADDINDIRGFIAVCLKNLHLRVESIMKRINALNEFWRCNGHIVEDEDIYKGIEAKDPTLHGHITKRFRKGD